MPGITMLTPSRDSPFFPMKPPYSIPFGYLSAHGWLIETPNNYKVYITPRLTRCITSPSLRLPFWLPLDFHASTAFGRRHISYAIVTTLMIRLFRSVRSHRPFQVFTSPRHANHYVTPLFAWFRSIRRAGLHARYYVSSGFIAGQCHAAGWVAFRLPIVYHQYFTITWRRHRSLSLHFAAQFFIDSINQ